MNIEKLSEKVNPYLDRKEYVFNAEFDDKTISNVDAKKEIAKLLGTGEDLIVVKKILQKFGIKQGKIYAYLYFNKEIMNQLEIIHKKVKKKEEAKPAQ